MSFQPQFPGIFDAPVAKSATAEDAATPDALPATEKQIHYAQALALKTGVKFPADLARNRAALSRWIDAQKSAPAGKFTNYPSSKQVAFAERIARLKRQQIPPECFRDRTMMSRWIDGNKPR